MAEPTTKERGQVVPLLLIVLALATAAAVVVAQIAGAAVERSRAQTAADAAALAGAAEGDAAARAAARANDGELTGYRDDGDTVIVDVDHGRAAATAAATADPAAPAVPAGGGDRAGLAPVMVAALARADALLGRPVPVVSGRRTRAEQEALWADRHRNRLPVAPPGTSLHEHGLAIDVPSSFVDDLLVVAATAGLCRPLPQADPIHFEPCPPTSPA